MIISRKNILTLNVSSEIAIHDAIKEVENLGADEKLTEAVMLLSKAKDLVSEYVDNQIKK